MVKGRWKPAVVAAGVLWVGVQAAAAPPEIRSEMPKRGELRTDQVVYVDDGKCPPGEVKEVRGGNRDKAVRRSVRCVKRPR